MGIRMANKQEIRSNLKRAAYGFVIGFGAVALGCMGAVVGLVIFVAVIF